MTNQSLIAVPPNVTEPVVLQRFILRLVEELDILLGFRGTQEADVATDLTELRDRVVVLEQVVVQLLARVSALESAVDFAEQEGGFRQVTTSTDYTTSGNEIIACTNTLAITVVLNSSPVEAERVYINQTAATVIVDANGKTINGSNFIQLNKHTTSRLLAYKSIIAGWLVI